ncbi:MAG: orotate phosphoribosyltransferase [Candidatus Nanoarchaeia archaeon]|jgi:orotate phosphoribosyltransferase|nr:orotate phosphoribosyltransferase [Candidatus Nanoarchaeia archaeon]|tara:strand:- start:26556 stop:27050 length:495 start_codon:yes stop_codon:yes gene_type:complete
MSSERVAEILLNTKAVTLRPSNPYEFVSGILSPIYCDNRLLMSHVKEREEVSHLFVELIQGHETDILAGTESAGIPWAAWVSNEIEKPIIYVRKKTKDHGKENLIEGLLTEGQKVAVIEDLISTGGSSMNAVNAVRQAGGNVDLCYAIFTYEFDKSKRLFTEGD